MLLRVLCCGKLQLEAKQNLMPENPVTFVMGLASGPGSPARLFRKGSLWWQWWCSSHHEDNVRALITVSLGSPSDHQSCCHPM